ncbi:ubiquitin-conjugating enzyme E2 Z [Rhipicephalus sanguineus]|uniref:Ubiquitin-conjugating enzyme E2 Z n=1 Tax=Rhipicephalus sanguineus TaxID=34632 RepID=A0A9D4TD96_RHISA|nr:ubiquitin-conjugating enzyme E2 Z [Rhipicephalus sanguineus]KAH7986082.1 hypothetical protein HPB52_025219 [Rhipicephalus sanguineus]
MAAFLRLPPTPCFHLTCPLEYPMVPPMVRFLTTDSGRTQIHPFFYRNGNVSLSILGTYAGPQWTPAQSLRTLLLSIQSLLSAQPFYDSPLKKHANKEQTREDAESYNSFVKHEVLRVGVCDVVQDCLEERSPHPAALRDFVLKSFADRLRQYEDFAISQLHLHGKKIFNPFSSGHGKYKYEALLAKLQELKLQVHRRNKAATVPGSA